MRETYAQAQPDSPANPAEFFTPSALVQPISEDLMLVTGMEKLTASLIGCRMINHRAERSITRRHEKATIRMHRCFDKDNEEPLNSLALHSRRCALLDNLISFTGSKLVSNLREPHVTLLFSADAGKLTK